MKKIAKYSLVELSKVMPTLSEKEQAGYVGGGSGTKEDPYTMAEYARDRGMGKWGGGYVVGLGYVEAYGDEDPYMSNFSQYSIYLGMGYYGSTYDPNKDATIITNEAQKEDGLNSGDPEIARNPAPETPSNQTASDVIDYQDKLRADYGYIRASLLNYPFFPGGTPLDYYATNEAKASDILVYTNWTENRFYIARYNSLTKKFIFDTREGDVSWERTSYGSADISVFTRG